LNILDKWFIIDLLKLLSRVGVLIVVSVATVVIQLLRPVYGFVDILLILAVGMVLGAVYIEVQKRVSVYLDRQSKPA
jgi:glucose uptake protein GlcU